MRKTLQRTALWASGIFLIMAPALTLASELHFDNVAVGESKTLRLYGGLGLSTGGSTPGGNCAKGMVTTRIVISGANAADFQDLGGTYVGLHVPRNRYYEDIRFAPLTVGDKISSFAPESNPVSPLCGLKTRASNLFGTALPPKHKTMFTRLTPHHRTKRNPNVAENAMIPGMVRPDLPPSIGILAGLSRNVYSGNSAAYGYHFLGDTCTLMQYNCDEVGFIASAYQSIDGSETVVAIRGSSAAQTSLRDGIFAATTESAIELLGPKVRHTLVEDIKATAAFVKDIAGRYSRSTITLTGHSVGGAIAQLVGSAAGDSAYVFNAPGAKLLFNRLAIPLNDFSISHTRNYQNINVRMMGDQVSQAGVPIGHLITIEAPAALNLGNLPSSIRAITCTKLLPTLSQLHAMDTMVTQINHDAPTIDGTQDLNLTPALTANLWCEDPSSLF